MKKRNNPVKKHMDVLHKPRIFLDKTKVIPRKSKYYSSESLVK